jgi:hypothetical protein
MFFWEIINMVWHTMGEIGIFLVTDSMAIPDCFFEVIKPLL